MIFCNIWSYFLFVNIRLIIWFLKYCFNEGFHSCFRNVWRSAPERILMPLAVNFASSNTSGRKDLLWVAFFVAIFSVLFCFLRYPSVRQLNLGGNHSCFGCYLRYIANSLGEDSPGTIVQLINKLLGNMVFWLFCIWYQIAWICWTSW